MNRRKNKDLPSAIKAGSKVEFSIEKKILIQIIVLILLILVTVGCMSKNMASTKRAYCNNGFQITEGAISAESDYKYWIVDDDGNTWEYVIQDCSMN